MKMQPALCLATETHGTPRISQDFNYEQISLYLFIGEHLNTTTLFSIN